MPSTVVRSAVGAESIPRAAWDELATDRDIYLHTRWLDVVDRTVGVPVEYFWVEEDGALRAALVAVAVGVEVPWALGRLHTVLDNSVAAGEVGAADVLDELAGGDASTLMPSMTVGGRHVGSHRLLMAPDADSADVHLLLDAVEARARELGVRSISLPYLDETDEEVADVLVARGYAAFGVGRFSRLTVPEGDFEDYLRPLSRNRRTSVRAERRKIGEAGVTTALVPIHDAPVHELVELEASLLDKYGIAGSRQNLLAIMEQTAAVFGDDARVALAHAEGRVRGFVMVLAQGSTWNVRQIGFDYAYQERAHVALYFELMFYSLVEWAMAEGVTEIQYGLGSVEAKRSRGCFSTTQRAYVLSTAGPS